MIKVIVLNGAARTGKDTFVRMVRGNYPDRVIIHSTVDTVKRAARLFGADEEKCKGEKERQLWSDMKDAWTRYNDGPFKEIVNKAERLEKVYDNPLLFCMIREPEEIRKVADYFGSKCMTVLIKRACDVPEYTNHADMHVANYLYDLIIINNNSLSQLTLQARHFVKSLMYEPKRKEGS